MKFRIEIFLTAFLILLGILMIAAGPEESLDSKLFYTSDEAKLFLNNLSLSENEAYTYGAALDLLFLGAYSLLSFFLFRRFQIQPAGLTLIPGVLDSVETSTILLLLEKK